MRANVVELAKFREPEEFKQGVLEFIGDISDYEILNDRVLVATYVPPNITAGGIHLPQSRQMEARFTGCAGLVLKLGPSAFKYDGQFDHVGAVPSPGDWVQLGFSESREFFLGPRGSVVRTGPSDHGVSCRLVRSESIVAILDDPQRVGSGHGFENL